MESATFCRLPDSIKWTSIRLRRREIPITIPNNNTSSPTAVASRMMDVDDEISGTARIMRGLPGLRSLKYSP